jgi:copper chaperone CopZ
MSVDGMVCAFCMQGIEKKLRGHAATQDVYIDLERQLVAVALKDRGSISDAELERLLTEAGYALREVRRTRRPLAALRDGAS